MKRGSGVLAHISSLPSRFGIGDLGPQAHKFVDSLYSSSQTYWQILPLSPTMAYTANSPYNSSSANAGNPMLISPELLVEGGWCDKGTLSRFELPSTDRVNFDSVYVTKGPLLREVYEENRERLVSHDDYQNFCASENRWLEPYALYCAIKERMGGKSWTEWPSAYRDRNQQALSNFENRYSDDIDLVKFIQFLFWSQWNQLRTYCRDRSVQIIGDLPIYVSLDSADVWSDPDVFKLGQDKQPLAVAGVPPDYFSETGQHWGNPVYDWDRLAERGFDWWLDRIEHNLKLYDLFRLDHFRGLVAYWEIPAVEPLPINGYWEKVPVVDFLKTVRTKFPNLPLIAEDLGTITEDVTEVMKVNNFPGMRIFQFGFSGDLENHPYLPHNYVEHCVAYSGTHDNNTTNGWFADDIDDRVREIVREYLRFSGDDSAITWEIIASLMRSKADLVIFPLQDLLGLGTEARMNRPSTTENNWQWRMLPGQLDKKTIDKLCRLSTSSKRGRATA